MKKLILLTILILYCSFSYGQSNAKKLTTADSVLNIYCQSEWLEVAVSDTGAADTVLVYYPITTVAGTTDYALIGSIKELATNDNVVGLYGSADNKVYILWLPHPRGVRFILSDYASGDVYIKTTGKPN